ncbi:MAG: ribosome small subunit-dependent GTPase A [Treponema sp.]
MIGLVLNGANNFFTVQTEESGIIRCSIKGKKLKGAEGFYNPLAPGDSVEIEIDTLNSDQGQIIALMPRKNSFMRWNQKTGAPQLLACNIDAAVCVTTPANPPFRPRFTDRILVQAESLGIPVIIAVNKKDLGISKSTAERLADWQRLGYTVRTISAKTGEGIEALAALLHTKTCVITGQSGVGKSSLLNAFSPDLHLKTAAISYKYDRGMHTTTQGVLLTAAYTGESGTAYQLRLIDTPGIRHFAVWGIKPDDVVFHFPEMAEAALQCSFGLSCSHTSEQGCRILHELSEHRIHPDRYESWCLIRDELKKLTAGDY